MYTHTKEEAKTKQKRTKLNNLIIYSHNAKLLLTLLRLFFSSI